MRDDLQLLQKTEGARVRHAFLPPPPPPPATVVCISISFGLQQQISVLLSLSHLATSGVNTVEQLCESHVGAMLLEGAEEEEADTEPEVVPNFAEAHAALMKVKSFAYAHSNSDGNRDIVLSLESSFFELRRKVATKQLSITEFFQKN
jgi:hypothetical protein